MRRIIALVVTAVLAFTMLTGVAQAMGAEVNQDRFDEGHFTSRVLPNGKCLFSHEQGEWGDAGFEPGQGNPVGNFTDFYVGGRDDPGRLEFGLVTPSGRFSGQSHRSGEDCID